MGDVIIVGSSNTDMVLNVPDIPRPGQTLSGDRFAITGGGKGANQAVAAVRAGTSEQDIYFVACVGDDDLGESSLRNFVQEGINTAFVSTEKDISSGVALIFVAANGENCIGINPGANARLSTGHLEKAREAICNSEVMLTQLEVPVATVLAALQIAKSAGTRTILNPAPAQELPVEIFALLDYFTPNQTETEMFTGIFPDTQERAEEAARVLLEKGVENVIITMGSKGVFCMNKELAEFVPAVKVKAVDTVAAGDTFNGALAAAIARGEALPVALKFANAAAAIAVTRKGAQESAPFLSEIRASME